MTVRTRPPRGGRFRFGAAAGATAALALAGCVTAGTSTPAPQAAAPWGDRTVAMTYRDGDPLVAYLAPGTDSGAITVWDGGEPGLVSGRWSREGRRICMTVALFRRESSPQPPLRTRDPACFEENAVILAVHAWRGDVFSLNGKSEVPYILSRVDNERLLTVLNDAERVRS